MKSFIPRPYIISTGLVALVTAAGFATGRVLQPTNIGMLYLLAVLASATWWGRRAALFTAIACAVVFNFCFIPPYFSFHVTDLPYVITLVVFIVAGLTTSEFIVRQHELMRAQAARAEAEGQEKAKDEILHKIAHELRSPLTAILGWTQLLARADVDGPQRRLISRIDHSSLLLARLVGDLVTASQARTGKLLVDRDAMALGPTVAAAADLLAEKARSKGVRLQTTIQPVDEVFGDEQRIEQVAVNLIANAIKFTPTGGIVSVRVRPAADYAQLVVVDTGAGITTEFLPHVFEPFRQGDPKHASEGLGLGLSIVKNLVSAHDGTLTVASEGCGCGSTFIVTLPTMAHAAAWLHTDGSWLEAPHSSL